MTPAAARQLARLAQLREMPGMPGDGSASRQRMTALREAVAAAGAEPRAEAPARSTPFGLAELDALTGGVPGGRVSELAGPPSCGKTSLALRALAGAQASGRRMAALVDLTRTVMPEGAWARELLVVRPKRIELGLRALDVMLGCAAFSMVALVAPPSLKALPEAVRVRVARLCREGGTSLLSCCEHPLFGSSAALRLDLAPQRDGSVRACLSKNRGRTGEVAWLRRVA